MNFLQVVVKSVAQLEEGAYYFLKGEDASGYPIPPQLFHLEKKHLLTSGLGLERLVGTLVVDVGQFRMVRTNHSLFPSQINLPEHGIHNIHLEKILNPSQFPSLFRIEGPQQLEIQQDKKRDYHEGNIVKANRWTPI